MILEYAQLLSTAHRLIDGKPATFVDPDGRKRKFMLLDTERVELVKHVVPYFDEVTGEQVSTMDVWKHVIVNPVCYSVTHANHPSAVWARTNQCNYLWLVELFKACLAEYTYRYGKVHATSRLDEFFTTPPKNIFIAQARSPFPQAMPDQFKAADAIRAYQNYYLGSKASLARWTNRPAPGWFSTNYEGFHASNFERTNNVA